MRKYEIVIKDTEISEIKTTGIFPTASDAFRETHIKHPNAISITVTLRGEEIK
jgi:hypothetical protein